jgi:Flp pilus assembly protein CpaB
VTSVPKNQLAASAIADPAAIRGRIAAVAIYPGEQLTQQDFTTENATSLPYELTGSERAVAVPVDPVHGLIGQVAAGDFVDVYVSINGSGAAGGRVVVPSQVRLLAPDVMVLATSTASSTATSSPTVLEVTTANAAKFAYAADYDRIWLVLRPQVGARRTPPEVATLATLLGEG